MPINIKYALEIESLTFFVSVVFISLELLPNVTWSVCTIEPLPYLHFKAAPILPLLKRATALLS